MKKNATSQPETALKKWKKQMSDSWNFVLEKKWGANKYKKYMKVRHAIFGVVIPALLLVFCAFFPEPLGITPSIFYFLVYLTLFGMLAEKQYRIWTEARFMSGPAELYDKTVRMRNMGKYLFFYAVLFPIPFLPYTFLYKNYVGRLRRKPRNCSACGNNLELISEADDDNYLSASAQTEEKIRSVDYDVWNCKNCDHRELLPYQSFFSSYSECPSCNARTCYMSGSRVLQAATYDAGGTGQKSYACKNCSHTYSVTYSIPKKQRSSSSGSSGGGGGGGSSWGGGSFGGGGAGSSW